MSTKIAMTWEEFLAAGQEGQRWEWVDGEIQVMSPVNFSHEETLAALIAYLRFYCRAHPEWTCFASNCVFTMTSGNWRMPDASLVRKDRFPRGRRPVMADFPPDVAFEILSPGTRHARSRASAGITSTAAPSRCGSISRIASWNWFSPLVLCASSTRMKRCSLTACQILPWSWERCSVFELAARRLA